MASRAVQNGQKPKNIFESPAYKSVEANLNNIFHFGEALENPNADFEAYQERVLQNFDNIKKGLPAENMQTTEEYQNLVRKVNSIFKNNEPTQ